MQFLANFQFDIQYKRRRNVVADAISKNLDDKGIVKVTPKIKLSNMSALHAYIVSSVDATELNKMFDKGHLTRKI